MKTTFKLLAISAVAMTLVACGGGGGGGSVGQDPAVIAAQEAARSATEREVARSAAEREVARLDAIEKAKPFYFGDAAADKSISSGFGTKYGAGSDLGLAHADGWKGQGTTMITMTTNIYNAQNNMFYAGFGHSTAPLMVTATSSAFNAAVNLAAPSAVRQDRGNFVDSSNPTVSSYTAFSTSSTSYAIHAANPFTVPLTGVVVSSVVPAAGVTATYVLGSRNVSFNRNHGSLIVAAAAATDATVTFNGVNTGDATKNAGLSQQQKVAYISGSAAVVQSKFNNLTNVEVVKYMDSTTEAGRIFRLGNTLAPRVLR